MIEGVLSGFDYAIRIESGRVIVHGKNDGNIRCRGQKKVGFTADSSVPANAGFTISATAWEDNDSSSQPEPANPFVDPLPAAPVRTFASRLVKPEKAASQLVFKYTVHVDGNTDADPVIIIEKV
jgi:hypothetical protein